MSETESSEEIDTSPGAPVSQRPTSGPSAFPIHPTHNFLHPVPPTHPQSNSASQHIFLNFPIPTSGAQSQTFDQSQHQLLIQTGSAAGDLQPAVFQFRAVTGQGAPKIMRLSTSTNNIHNLTQNRSNIKPAHRTKSLSTTDSAVINPTVLAQQSIAVMQEPQINIAIEQQNLHRKLDKSSSLPIYAQQTTLPAGTTITALPGYVYAAPAPATVQLTPFYSAVPGPFIQPTIPYGIPTVSALNSKRHKISATCPTSEAMSTNQKQALGPLA